MDGYTNTQRIRAAGDAYYFAAAYAVDLDNGWYLPAAGQMRLLYAEIVTVNQSLELVGGTPIDLQFSDTQDKLYWTSTEGDVNSAYSMIIATGVQPYNKTYNHSIRGACNF